MTTLPGLAWSLTAARADAVIVHTYSWMTAVALQHPAEKPFWTSKRKWKDNEKTMQQLP